MTLVHDHVHVCLSIFLMKICCLRILDDVDDDDDDGDGRREWNAH